MPELTCYICGEKIEDMSEVMQTMTMNGVNGDFNKSFCHEKCFDNATEVKMKNIIASLEAK